ncbi:Cytochrome bd-I ubiquinol oxidase subunit 2 [Rhodobacteraceae bacterium THAF1]|uniref:cytochrome d ubiquinol oxidase subunit II n=1 Tax=Palleronia sp. THAF1 TaxID=2587842 RepID=UPI000F3DEDAA|nr:cytochrome d ubiquinol oxidase subunit II [Palleronia sp. THAF1]QFU09894.1 Cytochrome bd-I ubiquinol oxidase subunit 2 [Palleronia sp. THAF1]VDC17203.1 Cytochrome bd-I ubiquinol oxidase subunit 2 [Rhodobacteraceae bacterium THAF1]
MDIGLGISIDLTIAWAILLAFAVYVYVILDGFDLGIGILYPAFPAKEDRDLMMNTVAPVWDGNETWLVLGGGGLFAAFPMAYAIIMPALYPPIIAMLLALVFRGVAFEFRWKAASDFSRRFWDWAFIGGSTVAALSQGIILGALLQGIEVDGRAYGGGWLDWLTPFSVTCGVAVIFGYGLLGACWLNWRTTGYMREQSRYIARMLGFVTVAFIGIVSLWTPFLEQEYFQRWFAWPSILQVLPIPALVIGFVFMLGRELYNEANDWMPFVLTLGLFGLCFLGLGVCMWPYIIPTEVTMFEAASPFKSQLFMFVGAIILIPIILAYTIYAYWVFRGKLEHGEGYH